MPQRKISPSDLESALDIADAIERQKAIATFGRSRPDLGEIPVLIQMLSNSDLGIVRFAAERLGKLGPAALNYGLQTAAVRTVTWELVTAASRVDPITHMPQAYPDCLEALVKIDPKNFSVFALIRNFISLDNWYPLKASLNALRVIDTVQARELMHRAIIFWWPELNKKQKSLVAEIAHSTGVQTP